MSDAIRQKVSDRTGQKRYGKGPFEVLEDGRLNSDAKVIFTWLAGHVFHGKTCSVGCRRIAERVHLNKDTVVKALRELEITGHISIVGTGRQRSVYILNSETFGQKQGKEDVLVSSPSGHKKRFASIDHERHGLTA